MKKIIASVPALLLSLALAFSAGHAKFLPKCSSPDNVVGKYFIDNDGQTSKVRCYKEIDGTYSFRMYDMPLSYDKDGKVVLDRHNPDKALRSQPANQIKIIWGLRYNAEDKCWDGGTIYDPRNGLTADATVDFVDGGRIVRVRGSVFGIGKSVYWEVVE